MDKYDMLETMTGAAAQSVLSAYLDLAKDAILNRMHPFGIPEGQDVPAQYESLQCEIAAHMINKRGAEGETVHLENGISRHYESGDIPYTLLRRVVPLAGVL